MYLVTSNIKSNPLMPRRKYESDMTLVSHKGKVFFFQEIAPKGYKNVLARVMAARHVRLYGLEVECPVGLGSYWTPVGNPDVVLTHHGRAATTPNRYFVGQVARPRLHKSAVETCFIATHFVSGGWHRGFKAFKAWRRAQWAKHFLAMQAYIDRQHAQGRNIVVGMDANRTLAKMPLLHRDQVIVAEHGIDGIIAIPAQGYKVVVTRKQETVRGLFTDHPALAVGVSFVKG